MTTDQAITHFGSIKELAHALGVWPNSITRWGEYPPRHRQFELERITNGKLKIERGLIKRAAP